MILPSSSSSLRISLASGIWRSWSARRVLCWSTSVTSTVINFCWMRSGPLCYMPLVQLLLMSKIHDVLGHACTTWRQWWPDHSIKGGSKTCLCTNWLKVHGHEDTLPSPLIKCTYAFRQFRIRLVKLFRLHLWEESMKAEPSLPKGAIAPHPTSTNN